MAEAKLGNPAAVGLGGFALTTFILQLHNLGWIGVGPIVACGLIYGGLAQLIAGLQEQKTGNNFGYCAFTSYGAFWIALGVIFLLNHFNIYKSKSNNELLAFLFVWTIYTAIMWIGSMKVSNALAWALPDAFAWIHIFGSGTYGYACFYQNCRMGSHHLCLPRLVCHGTCHFRGLRHQSSGRQTVD